MGVRSLCVGFSPFGIEILEVCLDAYSVLYYLTYWYYTGFTGPTGNTGNTGPIGNTGNTGNTGMNLLDMDKLYYARLVMSNRKKFYFARLAEMKKFEFVWSISI